MSGIDNRLSIQKQKYRRRGLDSPLTFGFQEARKSDLREMLREAVENTAKQQQEEPKS